ncbi:MAG TPA: hypothetical protein VMK42_13515 [Anaeromyxobacteraceae bacterium]|nr:hypothetical protein [Anaeromyxobacteraceae bacterium]
MAPSPSGRISAFTGAAGPLAADEAAPLAPGSEGSTSGEDGGYAAR